jgi:L-histidine N-alpha-methyltransferase
MPPHDVHPMTHRDDSRLVLVPGAAIDTHRELATDVRRGLANRPYQMPPKYFYDAVGSELFDRICDTPEYYLTRAETSLLVDLAPSIVDRAGAEEILELGSGAARKTRLLLDALALRTRHPVYIPVDVSESMLVASAHALLADYPTLNVRGVVGDYRARLGEAPRRGRGLVSFLGSSIGNYASGEAEALLADVSRQMRRDDSFLIGFDLVKDVPALERAYNDAAGITAAFNRNVLVVINRELGGHFDPIRFDHVAFYERDKAQIEMHLRARETLSVSIDDLAMRVPFEAGETIHTEISRKFTRETAESMLRGGAFEMLEWHETAEKSFALALARPRR